MYKIIIAEDDANQRRGLSRINFNELGMKLIGAYGDGESALKAHQKDKADIIITDIEMPGKNGIEFLKNARSISEKTMFIIISGYAKFEYARSAIELGVLHYILKPFNKKEIINKLLEVRALLEKRDNLVEKDLVTTHLVESNDTISGLLKVKSSHLSEDTNIIIAGIKYKDDISNKLLSILDSRYLIKQKKLIIFVYICNERDNISQLKILLQKFLIGSNICFAGKLVPLHDLDFGLKTALDTKDYLFSSGQDFGFYNEFNRYIDRPSDSFIIDIVGISNCIKVCDKTSLRDLFDQNNINLKTLKLNYSDVIREYCELINRIKRCQSSLKWDIDYLKSLLSYEDINEYAFSVCNNQILQSEKNTKYSYAIQEVINYIAINYSNSELSLKEISNELGYGYTGLSRDFHHHTDMTFKVFLSEYRVEKAKYLLLNSNLKMYEIAEQVGLSTKNFNRLFLKITGSTPLKYRRY